jgi:hypothetical protein
MVEKKLLTSTIKEKNESSNFDGRDDAHAGDQGNFQRTFAKIQSCSVPFPKIEK